MENNWKDFDKETKSTIKELIEDNKSFNELMAKLNSARENLEKKPELIIALQKTKK